MELTSLHVASKFWASTATFISIKTVNLGTSRFCTILSWQATYFLCHRILHIFCRELRSIYYINDARQLILNSSVYTYYFSNDRINTRQEEESSLPEIHHCAFQTSTSCSSHHHLLTTVITVSCTKHTHNMLLQPSHRRQHQKFLLLRMKRNSVIN